MSHPLGSPEIRLLVAWVNAVLDHGEWNAAARADFETAINREIARIEGDRDLFVAVFDAAGLTAQEWRAMDLAVSGWTPAEIRRELAPRHADRLALSIATVDRYLRRGRAKIRPLVNGLSASLYSAPTDSCA